MPLTGRQRNRARSVDEDALNALLLKGHDHPLIRLRLDYSESSHLYNNFVKKIAGDRVYPEILPTQASGRWSTKNPPLTNYPRHDARSCSRCGETTDWCPRDLRGLFVPNQDWVWLSWDYDAVEAILVSILTRDERDLEAFRHGYDIHTLTACDMFGLQQPPLRTKALHHSPEAADWREHVGWGGDEDKRRHIAKTMRYALAYCPRVRGEYAVLGAKGVNQLGVSNEDLLRFARLYMASKRKGYVIKHQWMDKILEKGEARTAFGRVRRFAKGVKGTKAEENAREGWSHMISGTVSGVMNRVLKQLVGDRGILTSHEGWLAINKHDSASIALPAHTESDTILDMVKAVVCQEWNFWGTQFSLPAQFIWYTADGAKHKA